MGGGGVKVLVAPGFLLVLCLFLVGVVVVVVVLLLLRRLLLLCMVSGRNLAAGKLSTLSFPTHRNFLSPGIQHPPTLMYAIHPWWSGSHCIQRSKI